MLGKPQNGWTIISYNGREFAEASYIDDVPLMVLDELLAYYTEPEHKFNLVFDNEPIEIGFVEFASEVYCVTNGIINQKYKDDIPKNMFVEFSEFFGCEYMISDVLINQLTKEDF